MPSLFRALPDPWITKTHVQHMSITWRPHRTLNARVLPLGLRERSLGTIFWEFLNLSQESLQVMKMIELLEYNITVPLFMKKVVHIISKSHKSMDHMSHSWITEHFEVQIMSKWRYAGAHNTKYGDYPYWGPLKVSRETTMNWWRKERNTAILHVIVRDEVNHGKSPDWF